MNTFLAKKVGEVLAFCEVGIDTFKRGRTGLKAVLSKEDLENLEGALSDHRERIIKISSTQGVLEEVTNKAEKTGEKLLSMQDLYLEGEEDWEDPAEMLEWLGFFEGAAIIHWSLVSGAAGASEISELVDLANEGNQLHRDALDIMAAYVANLGEETASR